MTFLANQGRTGHIIETTPTVPPRSQQITQAAAHWLRSPPNCGGPGNSVNRLLNSAGHPQYAESKGENDRGPICVLHVMPSISQAQLWRGTRSECTNGPITAPTSTFPAAGGGGGRERLYPADSGKQDHNAHRLPSTPDPAQAHAKMGRPRRDAAGDKLVKIGASGGRASLQRA